jgi:NADH:ubiquinone oxidoreductase subunit 4 (subunit M)
VTFYAALSIDTGVMMDFGLGGVGMGIFLVLTNLVIFGLLIVLGWKRFQIEQKKKSAIILTVCMHIHLMSVFVYKCYYI